MKENALVVKSNALIETSYRLTLLEQRILLACIAQVRHDGDLTDQVMYSVSAREISNMCGSDPNTTYRDLKAAALKLKRREVRISREANSLKRKKKTLVTGWVQSIEYCDGEGAVNLRLNHDILPYLSELNKCFTSYKLKNVIRMSSSYGVRIYELLAQWGKLGNRTISIPWLREALCLEKKYGKIGDFKKRVLDPAIKDINKNSDINVKVTQIKTGRKVTDLMFKFNLKCKEKEVVKKKAKMKNDTEPPVVEYKSEPAPRHIREELAKIKKDLLRSSS